MTRFIAAIHRGDPSQPSPSIETDEEEIAMSILVFLRELAGLTALFGTLFVWTLLGHAAGL